MPNIKRSGSTPSTSKPSASIIEGKEKLAQRARSQSVYSSKKQLNKRSTLPIIKRQETGNHAEIKRQNRMNNYLKSQTPYKKILGRVMQLAHHTKNHTIAELQEAIGQISDSLFLTLLTEQEKEDCDGAEKKLSSKLQKIKLQSIESKLDKLIEKIQKNQLIPEIGVTLSEQDKQVKEKLEEEYTQIKNLDPQLSHSIQIKFAKLNSLINGEKSTPSTPQEEKLIDELLSNKGEE